MEDVNARLSTHMDAVCIPHAAAQHYPSPGSTEAGIVAKQHAASEVAEKRILDPMKELEKQRQDLVSRTAAADCNPTNRELKERDWHDRIQEQKEQRAATRSRSPSRRRNDGNRGGSGGGGYKGKNYDKDYHKKSGCHKKFKTY